MLDHNKKWLPVSEAAKELHVSRQWLYQLIREGRLQVQVQPVQKQFTVKVEDVEGLRE